MKLKLLMAGVVAALSTAGAANAATELVVNGGFETVGEEIDEEPVTNDSWLGYTPFHYVILVVIGLVLGFVCWQLLSATSDSAAKAAPAGVAVVQGASPGSA